MLKNCCTNWASKRGVFHEQRKSAINAFQKYLTVWVILCMVVGVLIGKYLPGIPQFLNQFEYAKVSIPMAILIWLMIYPMMMKVDFQRLERKKEVLDAYHGTVKQADPAKAEKAEPKKAKKKSSDLEL